MSEYRTFFPVEGTTLFSKLKGMTVKNRNPGATGAAARKIMTRIFHESGGKTKSGRIVLGENRVGENGRYIKKKYYRGEVKKASKTVDGVKFKYVSKVWATNADGTLKRRRKLKPKKKVTKAKRKYTRRS